MHFAGSDGYQSFLVFVPMLSSLTLDSNEKVINWVSAGILSEKNKPFDTNRNAIMSIVE